jgi:hypothetical protein
MRSTAHAPKKQAQPAPSPASLPYVGYADACLLLGGCSETYLRELVAQRVVTAPVRLPGARGRRLFHVATLVADIDRLRAHQHTETEKPREAQLSRG